jgi:hypothetical protein
MQKWLRDHLSQISRSHKEATPRSHPSGDSAGSTDTPYHQQQAIPWTFLDHSAAAASRSRVRNSAAYTKRRQKRP